MADDDYDDGCICCMGFLCFYVLAHGIGTFFPSLIGWKLLVLAVVGTMSAFVGLTLLTESITNPRTFENIVLLVLYISILTFYIYNPIFNSKFSFSENAFVYIVALIIIPIMSLGIVGGTVVLVGGTVVGIWNYFAERIYVSSGDDELEFYTPIQTMGASQMRSGDDAIDAYTPIQTMMTSQIPMVDATPVLSINDVIEDAQCPYCGDNIRDTFYEHGGIVKCTACGAPHHRECFNYYKRCGSKKCKLRKT